MSAPIDDRPTFRVIDANLNRAREALRVMEDYSRFVLDDATLARAIKEARHTLAAAIADGLGASDSRVTAESLIRTRDIVGDVGQDIKTNTETTRSDAHAVAVAAAKRLSEALRSIEEFGKTIDPGFAQAIERLRYAGYELERRLAITAQTRERFARVKLYVVITESLCRGDWLKTARAAIDGGADCLQLREKNLPCRELLDRAKRLAELCHNRGTLFIVNDRPDIAVLSGANGVHLGQDDMPIAAARRIFSPTAIVGVSTHTIEHVRTAIEQVPDYIAVGPMFPSATKPQQHIAGPATLVQACSLTGLALVAIGGIDATNVEQVLNAASCTICVCSAVITQPDPAAACKRLRAIIDRQMASKTESQTVCPIESDC